MGPNEDVTLMICSCDCFEDAWELCSESIKKYWAGCRYLKVLVTDEKGKPKDGFFDNTINTMTDSWTRKVQEASKQITTPYVFFVLEDHFPTTKVNQNVIDKTVLYMNSHSDIGIVYMECDEDLGIAFRKRIPIDDYHEIPFGEAYRVTTAPALWRKEYLELAMDNDYSALEFERIIPFDSITEEYRVLTLRQSNWKSLTYAGAIHAGKWMRETVDYANEIGVSIDYNLRPTESRLVVLMNSIKGFLFRLCPTLIVSIQNKMKRAK